MNIIVVTESQQPVGNVQAIAGLRNQQVLTRNFAAPAQQEFLFCQTVNVRKYRLCARRGCNDNAYSCGGHTSKKPCKNEENQVFSFEVYPLVFMLLSHCSLWVTKNWKRAAW